MQHVFDKQLGTDFAIFVEAQGASIDVSNIGLLFGPGGDQIVELVAIIDLFEAFDRRAETDVVDRDIW